jgi:hypothetical protein|tara:strand:+ start:1271 stop:1384 length:114 start_codon:yes stop_codon:yes gene_type:complete
MNKIKQSKWDVTKQIIHYQANFIHKEADDALDSVVNF